MFFQIFQHNFSLFICYNFQTYFVKKHSWCLFRQKEQIGHHHLFRQRGKVLFKIAAVMTAPVKCCKSPILQNNAGTTQCDQEKLSDFYRTSHSGKSTETQNHQQRHDADVVTRAEGQTDVKTGQQRRYGKNKYRDRTGHETYMLVFIIP